MTGRTPIPAGVLTVDDERKGSMRMFALRVGGEVVAWCNGYGRARLLAGPARPDGVPDGAVPVTIWFGPENESGSSYFYMPDGSRWDWDVTRDLRDSGVPVPPYQPDHDPEALLVEKITADWTHPDPADSATERWCSIHEAVVRSGCDRCAKSVAREDVCLPVAGERTGPLGLSEGDTRRVANQWRLGLGGEGATSRALTAFRDACRAAVVEWGEDDRPFVCGNAAQEPTEGDQQ